MLWGSINVPVRVMNTSPVYCQSVHALITAETADMKAARRRAERTSRARQSRGRPFVVNDVTGSSPVRHPTHTAQIQRAADQIGGQLCVARPVRQPPEERRHAPA